MMRSLILAVALFSPAVRATGQAHPVVFVHGLLGQGNDFPTLASYISANFNVDVIQPALGWQSTYATQGNTLDDALVASGYDNSVAISHSNGSLVTRRYIVDRGAGSRIDRHLAIGGLHRGSVLAEGVRNGDFRTWLGQVASHIGSPISFYLNNDPALYNTGGWRQYLLGLLDIIGYFFNIAASVFTLDWAIEQAGFDIAVPVLAEMDPSSATVAMLNSSQGLAAEAAQTTAAGRVSIGTSTNADLLPWSNFMSRGDAAVMRTALRIAAWNGVLLYVYYSQHSDPVLRDQAWQWLQMYWTLELIPVSWASQIGALEFFVWDAHSPGSYFAPIQPNDGLLPLFDTQRYVGGTRIDESILSDILHREQRLHPAIRPVVDFALANDFDLGTPPPPPISVSVTIAGPSQVQQGGAAFYSANASGGGGGYTFHWYVSEAGGPLSYAGSGSEYTAVFDVCGSASVRVEVAAADSSAAADQDAVSVLCTPLGAAISGPPQIAPEATCLWVTSAWGGNLPYSYEWFRNGLFAGSGSEYAGGMDGASSFTLLLRVTDDAGTLVTDDMVVTNTGFGECLQ